MYIVIGLNGMEYGPIDMQTLQTWAAQGRVQPGSLIRDVRTGQQFHASQIPAPQNVFNSSYGVQMTVGQSLLPYAPTLPTTRGKTIQVAPGTHSVVAAVLLAVFIGCIPGLGQMYNKQVGKGVVIFLLEMVLGVTTLIIWPLLLLFGPIHLIIILDAGIVASRLDRGEAISPWQCF